MKRYPNKYLEKISSLVGEADYDRAVQVFLEPHRTSNKTLESLAKNLGVSAIVEEQLPFEGGIFEIRKQLVIKLNSFSPYVRRRFTLAHEIGHLLLASPLNARRTRKCAANHELERACDLIAAELLMPAAETVPFLCQLGASSPKHLRTVARRFGVSLQTAARRVHQDLKLWKRPIGLWEWEGRARELWFVGKRPWSTKQPTFAAFRLAKHCSEIVRTRESYVESSVRGESIVPVSLEVLNVGQNRILGMVGKES